MEFLQKATSPWGQEILVRVSWDLFWAVLIGSVVFLLVHQVLRRRWIGKAETAGINAGGIGTAFINTSVASLGHDKTIMSFNGYLSLSKDIEIPNPFAAPKKE